MRFLPQKDLHFKEQIRVPVLFLHGAQDKIVPCNQAESLYQALLAQGIGVWIGVQAIINIGVNMGVLPTKGLTLPLLSFGGSGILANCIAMAILLRIDFENRRLQKGLPA